MSGGKDLAARRELWELAVAAIPGISCGDRLSLLEKFRTEECFPSLRREDLESLFRRTLKPSFVSTADLFVEAAGQDEQARIRGISRTIYGSPGYPPLLGELYDPPFVLYYRGTLPDPEKPAVAVVGTRRPAASSARAAYVLSRDLAAAGFTVVSGLALGIDGMAHRGALDGKGRTAAVLGSGADMIYPVAHRELARRILEGGGSIVSEYPPGTRPYKSHFPQRNRIIAGLARGTVVMEAPATSGALHTARFALEQGRDLWVGEAGMNCPRSEGTRRLAEEGCPVAAEAGDILKEWGIKAEKTTER